MILMDLILFCRPLFVCLFHMAWILRAKRTLEITEFNHLLLLMRKLWCEERMGRRKAAFMEGLSSALNTRPRSHSQPSEWQSWDRTLSSITYTLISHRGKGLYLIHRDTWFSPLYHPVCIFSSVKHTKHKHYISIILKCIVQWN